VARESVPPRGSGWIDTVPIVDCLMSINHQSEIGNVSIHPLSRSGTDFHSNKILSFHKSSRITVPTSMPQKVVSLKLTTANSDTAAIGPILTQPYDAEYKGSNILKGC
jgi:hypothetical protein